MTRSSANLKEKKTSRIEVFAVLTVHSVKIKESKKRGKYLDLVRELKYTKEHEGDGDTICGWCTSDNPQRILKNLDKERPARLHY